jgi:hypothetical protein
MSQHGWDDERLGRAYTSFAGSQPPRDLATGIMTAVRASGQVHRHVPAFATRPRWLALGAAAVLVVALVGFVPGALQPPRGHAHLAVGGIELDYPSHWTRHDQGTAAMGRGSPWAVLGTLPWDPGCDAGDIDCYYREKLQPGTVTVTIGDLASEITILDPGLDNSTNHRATIAGMPAIVYDRGRVPGNYYEADLDLGWQIASPESPAQFVTIQAMMREPGVAELRRDVEAVVASLRFTRPVNSIPPSPGSAVHAVRIAAEALLARDVEAREGAGDDASSIYSCLPESLGGTGRATVAYGPGGWLGGPVQVECTATIETIQNLWWRVTFGVVSRDGSTRPGARYTETMWLTPIGDRATTSNDGEVPPALITSGPGAAAAAARAVAIALDNLGSSTPDFYGCFPKEPGASRTATISTDPNGLTHYHETRAICATRVEPKADWSAWRLILTATWKATGSAPAGRLVATLDVDAVGQSGPPIVTGDPIP